MSKIDILPDSKEQDTGSLPSASVILLNGFPGVGKLTIAKAFGARLELAGIPYRLVDSHVLIDPAVSIEPIRNEAHYALRKSFRTIAFEALKELKENRLVIVFTAALSTSALPMPYDDIDHFKEYVDLAQARSIPLVLINITCDIRTNSSRLASEERRKIGGKMKLVNVEILEDLRIKTVLMNREQALACRMEGDIVYLELDNSELAVEQAAQRIWELLSNPPTVSNNLTHRAGC